MITTARCLLSAPTVADRKPLIRLYTDSSVRKFLGGPLDEETAASRLRDLLTSGERKYAWVIREKGTRTIVGLATIDPHHDGQELEVSYQLLPEHQGHGYATEALNGIISYAFTTLGLSRLVSETQMDNTSSRRLLERIGMTLERTTVRFNAEQGIYSIEAGSDCSRPNKKRCRREDAPGI